RRTFGVTPTRVKVRPRRRACGGKLRVKASHPRTAEPARVRTDTQRSLEPLTGAFGLSAKIEPELGKAGRRVQ
ncbi:MAG: hypothetical protein ACR2LH_05930, partial [Thermoleophilaceae bacterium]